MAWKSKSGDKNEERNHKRRYNPRDNGNHTGTADWASATPAILHKTIENVTNRGCAILFSYSSDGGAYCMRIYGDGDPYSIYRSPNDSVDDWLGEISTAFED